MSFSLEGIVNAVFLRGTEDIAEVQVSEEPVNPILEFRRNFAEKHGRGHKARVDNAVHNLCSFINFVDPMRMCDLEISEVNLESSVHINGVSALEVVFSSDDNNERVAYLNYNASLTYEFYTYTPDTGCTTTRFSRSEEGLNSFRNDNEAWLKNRWHPAHHLKKMIDLNMRFAEDRRVVSSCSLDAA